MSAQTRPVAVSQTPFPAYMGAALIMGGLVYLVDLFDRRAATLLGLTLLFGVAVSRNLPAKLEEMASAIAGK